MKTFSNHFLDKSSKEHFVKSPFISVHYGLTGNTKTKHEWSKNYHKEHQIAHHADHRFNFRTQIFRSFTKTLNIVHPIFSNFANNPMHYIAFPVHNSSVFTQKSTNVMT